jgi:hypothetical protein
MREEVARVDETLRHQLVAFVDNVQVHRAAPNLTPNVRAKLAPTVGRQARAADNVPRTCGPGLAARRWGST